MLPVYLEWEHSLLPAVAKGRGYSGVCQLPIHLTVEIGTLNGYLFNALFYQLTENGEWNWPRIG